MRQNVAVQTGLEGLHAVPRRELQGLKALFGGRGRKALSTDRLRVSFPVLLALYSVLPIIVLVIGYDLKWNGGALQQALPEDPEDIRLVTVFLVYPHIFASALSFLDREYLSFYGGKIQRALLIAVSLGFLVPALCGSVVSALLFAIYTNFHVIAQQVGITTMMTGKPDAHFRRWKWTAIILSLLVYIPVYGGEGLEEISAGFQLDQPVLFWAAVVLLSSLIGLFLFSALKVSQNSRSRIGIWYVWSNVVMVALAAGFYLLKYPFFAILAPRLVHDLSGFTFYVVHDYNRNLYSYKNFVLKMASVICLPLYLFTPLLAILLANLVTEMAYLPIIESSLIALAYFHYVTEGFMWKHDAIHRKQVT